MNKDIKWVGVKQANSDEIKDGKIIDVGNKRIWLTYMEGFKGTEFEVNNKLYIEKN